MPAWEVGRRITGVVNARSTDHLRLTILHRKTSNETPSITAQSFVKGCYGSAALCTITRPCVILSGQRWFVN